MILAGDIGGTHTRLGLFDPDPQRPSLVAARSFITNDYPGLPELIAAFLADNSPPPRPAAAAFGIAGPVIDQSATMTNVPWRVDAEEVRQRCGLTEVHLINDLVAMASAVPLLNSTELRTLHRGHDRPDGNKVVVAAGTGLGAAFLPWINGHQVPVPSELGHSDFAARSDRELEFVRFARQRFGRVGIEHVVCGPGLVNLARFTHQEQPCVAIDDFGATDSPRRVSAAALQTACVPCIEALRMFVEAFGAVVGNLALTAVATGGIFVGGGIAPQILPALQTGAFIEAIHAKDPMRALLESMPVHVIVNQQAGLLGAAAWAQARPGVQSSKRSKF